LLLSWFIVIVVDLEYNCRHRIFCRYLVKNGQTSQGTWKAEIGRIIVPGQTGQRSLQDPISMEKNWVSCHSPVIPVMAGSRNRRIMVQVSLGKKQDLSPE
jgi:hypothetical protein